MFFNIPLRGVSPYGSLLPAPPSLAGPIRTAAPSSVPPSESSLGVGGLLSPPVFSLAPHTPTLHTRHENVLCLVGTHPWNSSLLEASGG